MKRLAIILIAVAQSALLPADEWGSVRGQILIEGEIPKVDLLVPAGGDIKDKEICASKDHYSESVLIHKESKGLANVFIYLARNPGHIHPAVQRKPEQAVEFGAVNCRYVPHNIIVRAGQPIEVRFDDAIAHNLHLYPLKNSPPATLIPPQGVAPVNIVLPVAETLPVKVTCDFHPWMSAYWLVVDHPYAAISDEHGRFEINNLPVGDHVFRVWHEKAGYLNRSYPIKVNADDCVDLPPMKIDITRLQKPAGK